MRYLAIMKLPTANITRFLAVFQHVGWVLYASVILFVCPILAIDMLIKAICKDTMQITIL